MAKIKGTEKIMPYGEILKELFHPLKGEDGERVFSSPFKVALKMVAINVLSLNSTGRVQEEVY